MGYFLNILINLWQEENQIMDKAINWFGGIQKSHLICKYFLPDRNPEFIES